MLVSQPRAVLKITHSQPTVALWGLQLANHTSPQTPTPRKIFSPTPVSVYQHSQHHPSHLYLYPIYSYPYLINYPERPAYGPQQRLQPYDVETKTSKFSARLSTSHLQPPATSDGPAACLASGTARVVIVTEGALQGCCWYLL